MIPQMELAEVIHSEQPVFILFDCMRMNNLRIVDLFHAFDRDRSNTLSRQEIRDGLLVSVLYTVLIALHKIMLLETQYFQHIHGIFADYEHAFEL